LAVRAGVWSPPAEAPPGFLGFLILDGIVLRGFSVGDRRSVFLLGPGDVIKPWSHSALWGDWGKFDWRAMSDMKIALLDNSFTEALSEFPELGVELVDRVLQRNRELSFNMAIASHTRVDTRVYLILWQMAAKWGKMRSDGVLLPVKLTHNVLSELVASRRPTITTALAELADRGLVQRVDNGWLLAGEPPAELLS
ncbi:MAG: Crp/Fnr family transcriptional regulator, partial [Solirubrobacterales bacterium]|nr:Crp/Fnr family transcriptional regulator [Solirubrobacterales bacterium]